jgi:hypothetical protein
MNRVQFYMENFFTSELKDNGGRRAGVDRRYFSYSNHIPERRLGAERRAYPDRRSSNDRRDESSNSSVTMSMRVAEMDRRTAWNLAAFK